MLAVAVTAVMMAHGRALDLEHVRVPARWFPGYSGGALRTEQQEVKAVWTAASGARFLGTKTGVFRVAAGGLIPARGLEGRDVKGLAGAATASAPVVATKDGLWIVATTPNGDRARRVLPGDIHSVAVAPDGTIEAVVRGSGVRASADGGRTWAERPEVTASLAALPTPRPPETVPLSRLALDVHTGKAFLGKRAEWIWIDVLGGVLAFLVATGVFLWWVARRRQRAQVVAARPHAVAAAGPSAPAPTPAGNPPGVPWRRGRRRSTAAGITG